MEEKDSLDQPAASPVRINYWKIEKLRIWFNLIIGGIMLAPLLIQLMAGNRYRSKRQILSEFVFEVSPYLIKVLLVYNLVFSVIYLFERSSLKRTQALMDSTKRSRVFVVILTLCIFHLFLLFKGGLKTLF